MIRAQTMASSIGWHLALLGLIVGTGVWLAAPPPEKPEVEIDLQRTYTPPTQTETSNAATADAPARPATRVPPAESAASGSAVADPAQTGLAPGSERGEGPDGTGDSPIATPLLAMTETPPAPEQTEIYRAGDEGVSGPQLIPGTDVQPEYPRPARIGRVEGVVELELTIGVDGVVERAEVIRESPTGYGFASAAQRAATQRRYRAAMRAGQPVAAKLAVDIEFRLE